MLNIYTFRHKIGGFMLGSMRFVVKTTVLILVEVRCNNDGFKKCGQSSKLVSDNCWDVDSACGSSGKNPERMVFTNKSLLDIGTKFVRRRINRCFDISAVGGNVETAVNRYVGTIFFV